LSRVVYCIHCRQCSAGSHVVKQGKIINWMCNLFGKSKQQLIFQPRPFRTRNLKNVRTNFLFVWTKKEKCLHYMIILTVANEDSSCIVYTFRTTMILRCTQDTIQKPRP
jgi:hypothetical protein